MWLAELPKYFVLECVMNAYNDKAFLSMVKALGYYDTEKTRFLIN